jgi:hypothetical protein
LSARIAPSELALGQYPERLTGRQCPEPTLSLARPFFTAGDPDPPGSHWPGSD